MLPEEKPCTMSAAAKWMWQCYYPAIITKRAKQLQINPKELKELSLIDLKRAAKRNFRELIKHYHPDTSRCRKRKLNGSFIFRRLVRAYRFICDLTEEDLEKYRRKEKEDRKYKNQNRYYCLPSLQWTKELTLPVGFQEVKKGQ